MIWVHGIDWSWSVPDFDVRLWQDIVKCSSDRIDCFGKHAIERQKNLMVFPQQHHRSDKRHRVTANASKPAGSLRTLHVDHNAHQRFPLALSLRFS